MRSEPIILPIVFSNTPLRGIYHWLGGAVVSDFCQTIRLHLLAACGNPARNPVLCMALYRQLRQIISILTVFGHLEYLIFQSRVFQGLTLLTAKIV